MRLSKMDTSPTIAGIMLIGLLAFSFVGYIFESIQFLSYAHRLGVQDPDGLRQHYFDGEPFLLMFKYFVWPIFLSLVSVACIFRVKAKTIGGLFLICAIWLMISALQKYYGILSIQFVLVSGCALNLIAIALYVLMLTRQKKTPA